jgi:hypothetical protein
VRKPILIYTVLSTVLGAAPQQTSPTADQIEFFEKRVRPILVNHCYTCHSADTQPHGELRVDDRNGLLTGGNSGPAVVPGHPEESLLLQRIRSADPKRRMPREGTPLTEAEIKDLATWISDGVAWPSEQIPASLGHGGPAYERLRARHWAWQPLTDPKVPVVANASWPSGEIDRFILAKLEQNKLGPVADADPTTLIRRLTLDLTGLPPSPVDIDAFVKDKSKDAYARLVDRLLQSPQFGERWGRHWLDVARYGESTGPSRNVPYPHSWRYRDYVIDALNRDVPFDRFIQEQVAGDLLPGSTPQERDRLLTATGFLALGPKDVNQRFKERYLMDNVDEQIDTVSRSILALTVSCARCHDHKFDPIPTTDYYALAGIFASTEDCAGLRSKMGGAGYDYYDPKKLISLSGFAPATQDDKVRELQAEMTAAKRAWDEIADTPEALVIGPDGKQKEESYRKKYEDLLTQVLSLEDPGTLGHAVHGVREAKAIGDTAIRIRGEAERVGPTVRRGFLTAFVVPGAAEVNPEHSGRLELAQWLSNSANPLTPRVIVNRVWQYLFDQGIVTTVDNFGITGDRPSHPELLDYLAAQFLRDGWSIKKLVRAIVLSHAYRLGSEAPQNLREVDPANRLIWRHSPRRLEAEEIRDAVLASAGSLELKPPAGSPVKQLKMIEIQDNGPEARSMTEQADRGVYRSVYLPLLRGLTPQSLDAFDPVSQTLVTGRRDATTVPTQALFLLNSTFVRRQSLLLADKLLSQNDGGATGKIRDLYLRILGRAPSKPESARADQFLNTYAADYRQLPPAQELSPVRTILVNKSEAKPDPDDLERAGQVAAEESIQPKTAREAAWMSLVQALYASAEFRFVR